jgi:Cft2 family RNA processing exonuclease
VLSLTVQFLRGAVFLPRLGLWLDAHHAVTGPERVFVSHAHSDHTARHREVILTAPTARLMQARLGGKRIEQVLPFGEAREFTAGEVPYRITLLPAGHILGSAIALVEADGESLLYTGDFKLRAGAAAELCEPRRADVLIMETTFGRPEYVFPPEAGVVADMVTFCREALAAGKTPFLLAYSLGKSQEILARIADAALPLAVHAQAHRLCQIYREFGQVLPDYAVYEPGETRGRVVVCPPNATRLPNEAADSVRRAVVTGWALNPGCRFQYGVDAAFPLSDHADFPDLLRLVELVRPRQVLALHGFATEFARTLRERGHDARALGEMEQLDLGLRVEVRPRRPRRRLNVAAGGAGKTAEGL